MSESKVAFGYLPNFKGGAAVLFAGNGEALERLADFLESIADRAANVTTLLNKEPLFTPKRGVRLTLMLSDSPLGMYKTGFDAKDTQFEWHISGALALRLAELIRAVARANGPSHQYLDSGGYDDIPVIVSKGEYDESWLQQM